MRSNAKPLKRPARPPKPTSITSFQNTFSPLREINMLLSILVYCVLGAVAGAFAGLLSVVGVRMLVNAL